MSFQSRDFIYEMTSDNHILCIQELMKYMVFTTIQVSDD